MSIDTFPDRHPDADASSGRPLRQHLARATGGTSPVSALTLLNDWALHLATAPDKQLSLAQKAQNHWLSWLDFVAKGCPSDPGAQPITPPGSDHRFQDKAWQAAPFAAMAQGFLLAEDFVDSATSDIPGLSPAHEKAMGFLARQMIDAFAPSNFLPTNPQALARTVDEKGANLVAGAQCFLRDMRSRLGNDTPAPQKKVGQDVALTPGKVVLRTHLMELIQYEPTTQKVQAEPILIVPAWIMKYYIMDLGRENSMVRYLVDQGFTVFMISWRNPGAEDAGLGMADYLAQGPVAAIDHICETTGAGAVHAMGYCLGGTLLSVAAAAMARDGDGRLHSMTLLAAQTDFTEAGQLMLFISESQVSFLEDAMAAQGFLDASQMAGTFQAMRSNDLIWSRMVHAYLMGEGDAPQNDLMSWNADTTRMPARMHSEYLRQLFLQNDLADGRYKVGGHPVSLRDIRIPVFAVGTETDHVAPWKSVYKIHALGHADVTFVLTNGGHNAGVISEPGHKHRHFRQLTTRDCDKAHGPDDWMELAELHQGSWWTAWVDWLKRTSSAKIRPPKMTGDLGEAPGEYVTMG